MPATENYITQAAADARYQALGGLSAATPAAETPDHAGTAGVSTSASKADHVHPITAGAPANIGLTGVNAEGAGTGFARDTHVHAYNPPSVIARRAAAQSITNATWTLITFDTEDRDTDSMFTLGAADRLTIVTTGLYHVIFKAGFVANTAFDRVFQICKGVTVDVNVFARAAFKSGNVDGTATVSADIPLVAGDTLSGQVYQNSGGALNTEANAFGHPRLSARWVAP